MKIYLPSNYYSQRSADRIKPYPAQGHLGWQKEMLPIETETTAFISMHAWDTGYDGEFPGWERCVDYLPRASAICRELMPPFFDKIRQTSMKLIHVAVDGQEIEEYDGWKKTVELFGNAPDISLDSYLYGDEAVNEVRSFKWKKSHVGEENAEDVRRGRVHFRINEYAAPKGDEYVVTKSNQLLGICKKHNIRHLIYTGFAINMCLLSSPGGMLDMSRYGIMCSSVRELTTAVESRESARGERNKEYGLWYDALLYGLVYDKDDLEKYVLDVLMRLN